MAWNRLCRLTIPNDVRKVERQSAQDDKKADETVIPPVQSGEAEREKEADTPSVSPSQTSLWRMIVPDTGVSTSLKFVADGSWKLKESVIPQCGMDGAPGLSVPDDQLILGGCPFGALIGKIGGSSAFHQSPDGEAADVTKRPMLNDPFAIGSYCVLKLPEQNHPTGPLFIGFNSVMRPVQIFRLQISVYSWV